MFQFFWFLLDGIYFENLYEAYLLNLFFSIFVVHLIHGKPDIVVDQVKETSLQVVTFRLRNRTLKFSLKPAFKFYYPQTLMIKLDHLYGKQVMLTLMLKMMVIIWMRRKA